MESPRKRPRSLTPINKRKGWNNGDGGSEGWSGRRPHPPTLGGKGSPSYRPSLSFPAPPPRPPRLMPPSCPPEPEAAAGEAAAPSPLTRPVPTPTPLPPPARHGPVTCSSKRLTTAWTHSTGLCAAMSSPRPGDGGGTGRPAPGPGRGRGAGAEVREEARRGSEECRLRTFPRVWR